uniref:Myticusin-alpha n=1 Tax=Mytilus coruscus TaxID=42192 RepID=M9NHP8_MYTCO|nr:myticusin-alpha precursor [Mytilus coruscus]
MENFTLSCLFFAFVALGYLNVSVGTDHQMAQSACIGVSQDNAYASAIPRDCHGGKTCEGICADATATMDRYSDTGGPLSTARCVNAFHFYKRRGEENVSYKPFVVSWKYGVAGCFYTHCGPNFCCCIS